MGDITTIGLDLAKSVFQVHAVDAMGSVVMRKRLRRSQVLAFFAEKPRAKASMDIDAGEEASTCLALGGRLR
jgi:transposase